MSDGAKQTQVNDPESATTSLAAMKARAETLDDTIKGIVGRITQHEGGKPWGTAPEFGGVFEKNYHAGQGGNGAQFVKDNVGILATETSSGVSTAHAALQGTVDLDKQISTVFTTPDSGTVGTGMKSTLNAWDKIHNDQQKGS
jgi:hypothetical protein